MKKFFLLLLLGANSFLFGMNKDNIRYDTINQQIETFFPELDRNTLYLIYTARPNEIDKIINKQDEKYKTAHKNAVKILNYLNKGRRKGIMEN